MLYSSLNPPNKNVYSYYNHFFFQFNQFSALTFNRAYVKKSKVLQKSLGNNKKVKMKVLSRMRFRDNLVV